MTSAVFAFAIKMSSLLTDIQRKPFARLLSDEAAYLEHRQLGEHLLCGQARAFYYVVYVR